MQLDQHPQPDPKEPVVDLTSDAPSISSARASGDATRARPFGLAAAIGRVIGGRIPSAVEGYDGSRIGPDDATTTLVVRSPKALRYAITAPGEIGIARAYVTGELDVE